MKGIWALHWWALPITFVDASCHSWCSYMPTKLSNLFLSNMPWFLYTFMSLLIPVTLPETPSLFASGKFFFVPPSTQRSHPLWIPYAHTRLMPPPLHCLSTLCTLPLLTFLSMVITGLHVYHFLLTKSFSRPRKMCPAFSVLDPQCLSIVLSTLNESSVKWFEWMSPGSDCGRNERWAYTLTLWVDSNEGRILCSITVVI